VRRWIIPVVVFAYAGFLVLVGASYYVGFRELSRYARAAPVVSEKEAAQAALSMAAIERRLAALQPRGVYIVVDTGQNRLYVKKGDQVLREAVVSCGSGDVLEEPGGKRKWIFDTPRGEFWVKSKITNPYWVKPDWAFIEEGEPIPKNPEDRVEAGSLGDYALGFGDGYFIHGTLYTRLLGRNVTHGCVRVGDNDLKDIFRMVPLGAKIFIY
jgi:lipoprotein-anchoring transpeptidase ErfK/SrfK